MKKLYLPLVIAGNLLLIGCNRNAKSTSEKFNALPPAVQQTIRAEASNAEIAAISSRNRNGANTWKVRFKDPEKNPQIEVASDGRLINTDAARPASTGGALTPTGATATKLTALPEAAQKTILSKAPDAPIAGITRRAKDGKTIYEIEFTQPGTNSTLQVAQDGTLVQDLQKKENQPTFPNAVP